MHIVRRAAAIAFLAGLVFICIGIYDLFIESGSQEGPAVVSIQELARSVPANRHLIVTGGKGLYDKALVAYKLKNGVRVPDSEVYYIPIADSSISDRESASPCLILKVSKAQTHHSPVDGLDISNLEGVRVTQWELDSDAEKLLDSSFGREVVRHMVILDYHRQMNGIGFGLAALALGGFLSAGSVIGYWFLQNASRSPVSTEPVYPPSFATVETTRRSRRIAILLFWFALIVAAPIIVLGVFIAIKGLMLLSGKH